MAKLLALLFSTGLYVYLGFGATGCSKIPETEKKNPDRQATDSKKPEIILRAKDVEIEVELEQNETKEEAKGVVTVSVQRGNMKEEEEIAVTFHGVALPQGVKIGDTKIRPKEHEATAIISVPKGTKFNNVKTPHSQLLSESRTVIVTGAAGVLKGETLFNLTLKIKRMKDK